MAPLPRAVEARAKRCQMRSEATRPRPPGGETNQSWGVPTLWPRHGDAGKASLNGLSRDGTGWWVGKEGTLGV